jgi:hypothetical protein
LCGRCKTPLEDRADPKTQDILACPHCGNSDTKENVVRIVQQYLGEETAKFFNDGFRGAFSAGKTAPTGKSGRSRFIVQLDLQHNQRVSGSGGMPRVPSPSGVTRS